MAVLCQLKNPDQYRPFDWSLLAHPGDFDYWVGLFEKFPDNIERRLHEDGLTGPGHEERWAAFRDEYATGMAVIRDNPRTPEGEVTTITLCRFRQGMLRKHGFIDPYVQVKAHENAAAVRLYRETVGRIDACPIPQRWELLLRALFAGNMFDLGAPITADLYHNGQMNFLDSLGRVPDRPWFIDDADALRERLYPKPAYRQILFFVDNAGTDIVLGVIPTVRELAREGSRVVMAANSLPALNDMTYEELNALLEELAAMDPELAGLLASDRIATVPSGCDLPLIDLSQVTDACNQAAAASDLIVLEGMGRGVESNWRQTFKCDTWRVALLKDECVVRWVGAHLFDPVCRFEPAIP